ncbi:hypothetical protein V8G54_001502 [Vigna mungo]|uniref:Uncharacterized protein n=1 Tax=Vigna mungo TaxID=3915 RepID=A0AAQ3PAJ1_VIGMU
MCIPWCKGHSYDVPFQKISTPTCNTTPGINCSSDSTSGEWNKLINVINVCISSTWKHGTSSRESESVTFNLNPVLNGFLNAELFVWNIVIPSIISALRPFERWLILWRSWYKTK